MKQNTAKRVVSVLLGTVLPVALVLGILVFAMQRSNLGAVETVGAEMGNSMVKQAQQSVQHVVDEDWNSIYAAVASLPDEFDNYTVSARIEWMQKVGKTHAGRNATYLYYSQSGECVGSDGTVKEMYYTSRPDISGILAGTEDKAWYGPVYEDDDSGEAAAADSAQNGERSGFGVYYTLPVRNSTGHITGAFSLRRDGYEYSDAISGLSLGEGGYTYLVDTTGMIVGVSRNEQLPLVTGETSHAGLDDVRAQDEAAAIAGTGGVNAAEDGVLAYAPLAELAEGETATWGVLCYLPKSDLRSYISRAANTGNTTRTVILLAVLLLALLTAFYFILDAIRDRRDESDRKAEEYRTILDQTLRALAGTYDARNSLDKGHGYRVAAYAREIGKHMNLDAEQQQRLYFEAALHDIGMVAVSDEILRHQAEQKLTADEALQVRNHVTVGGRILGKLTDLPGINAGAMYHQQFYDGNGYCSTDAEPLKGEAIPLEARIIAVADVYDELRGYGRTDLDIVLENGKGSRFDPLIADIMIQLIRDGTIQHLTNQTEQAMRSDSAELAEV